MTRQRDALSEALRELAATSPGASPDLHARLGEAFVHHHARRRLRQRTAVAVALLACVAMSIVWLRPHKQVAETKVAEPAPQTMRAATPEAKTLAPENPQVAAPSVARASRKPRVRVKVEPRDGKRGVEMAPAPVETADFVALPSFDPAVPIGVSHMVRMNLSGSALQLIGYPVEGQLLDRQILTDVLVGQDGMPYAVRLVQTRNGY